MPKRRESDLVHQDSQQELYPNAVLIRSVAESWGEKGGGEREKETKLLTVTRLHNRY